MFQRFQSLCNVLGNFVDFGGKKDQRPKLEEWFENRLRLSPACLKEKRVRVLTNGCLFSSLKYKAACFQCFISCVKRPSFLPESNICQQRIRKGKPLFCSQCGLYGAGREGTEQQTGCVEVSPLGSQVRAKCWPNSFLEQVADECGQGGCTKLCSVFLCVSGILGLFI